MAEEEDFCTFLAKFKATSLTETENLLKKKNNLNLSKMEQKKCFACERPDGRTKLKITTVTKIIV